MADHYHLALRFRRQAGQPVADAGLDAFVALAAGGCELPAAAAECLRVLGGEFVAQAPVPLPERHLDDPAVGFDGQAQGLGDQAGGGLGATERAGNQSPTVRFLDQVPQQPADGRALRAAERRQRGIEMPLLAPLGVERRFTVTDEVDHAATGAQARRSTVPSQRRNSASCGVSCCMVASRESP